MSEARFEARFLVTGMFMLGIDEEDHVGMVCVEEGKLVQVPGVFPGFIGRPLSALESHINMEMQRSYSLTDMCPNCLAINWEIIDPTSPDAYCICKACGQRPDPSTFAVYEGMSYKGVVDFNPEDNNIVAHMVTVFRKKKDGQAYVELSETQFKEFDKFWGRFTWSFDKVEEPSTKPTCGHDWRYFGPPDHAPIRACEKCKVEEPWDCREDDNG